jgi:hypothetical protein
VNQVTIEPEPCGCETCVIGKLIEHVSVSGTEALRWVLAAQFAGLPGLRCAR